MMLSFSDVLDLWPDPIGAAWKPSSTAACSASITLEVMAAPAALG